MPRVAEACQLLERFGAAARVQTEHDRLDAVLFRRQIARVLALCEENRWSPHQRGIAKQIAAKMDVTEREVRRYLRIYRTRM